MANAQTANSNPLTYSIKEFCNAVGISLRTFYTLKEKGDAPPVIRIGRRVLIRVQAAQAWLSGQEVKDPWVRP